MVDLFGSEEQSERGFNTADFDNQNGVVNKEVVPPAPAPAPAVGMEFDSYDDVYNFYDRYAKEIGFTVRVKNSCVRRKDKEKYRAVLCCSSQGLQRGRGIRSSGVTRTGCLAMIRIGLVGDFKWKISQAALEHNHEFSTARSKTPKSHKKVGVGKRRKLVWDGDVSLLPSSSNQVDFVDAVCYQPSSTDGRNSENCVCGSKPLELKDGDAQAIYNFFCRMQLACPDFFYIVDLVKEGYVGNIFWADARSRAAYSYFNDVVTFDFRYLKKKYEVPCVPIVGLNHHAQSVLLGCGLLADETFESYVWLFKSWLTCMSGCPPVVIITDQCKIIQRAIAEVFPGSHKCFSLQNIMNKAPEELRGVRQYEAVRRSLNKAVYDSLRVDEFETTWKDMVEQCGVQDHKWIQMLYENRKHWIPVFLKDFLFAGISTSEQNECMRGFFDGYLTKQSSLTDFLVKYDSALEKKRRVEAREDFDSIHCKPTLKTKCCFESQMSKIYTKDIFRKFQCEVEELYSCFNTTQVYNDGPIVKYIVKERLEREGNQKEIRNFEVLYNSDTQEVCCICGLFNFKGYLCRHALSVLHYNGVEEIPSQHIVSRWRRDFKCSKVMNNAAAAGDVEKRDQWYDRLYRCAVQIVEKGAISQEHYKVALQALEESLNKVCLGEEIESRMQPRTLQPQTNLGHRGSISVPTSRSNQ